MDKTSGEIVSRNFGLGAAPTDQGAMAAAMGCPFNQVPVLEYVTLTIPLPLQDTAVTATFGDNINVLNVGQSAPPGVVSVDSSFAINGILQSNMFVCGIGIHAFGEPISFSQIGNSVLSSLTAFPISPDVFSNNDLNNGALGSTAAGSMIPAAIEWGFADWMALWHMMNAYQFQWTFCQRYLLINELATDVAYYGPFADGKGMGDSDIIVQQFIRQVNSYYRTNGGSVFLPVTHRRVGSVNTGATGVTITANTGVFHPTRDFALAPVTFGGLQNQGTSGGLPFRKLTKPIYLQAGLPIKMQLVAQDAYHQQQMQRYMSISEGAGNNATAIVQVDTTLHGLQTPTVNQGLELTLDQGGNQFSGQGTNTDLAIYKGGVMKLSMQLKGFEVCGAWQACFQGSQAAAALASTVYIPNSGQSSAGVGLLGGRG
jgi:hypothetical protein